VCVHKHTSYHTHTHIHKHTHAHTQELYTYFEEYVEMSGEDAGTGKKSKLQLNNIK
jgi:hypothetical protein